MITVFVFFLKKKGREEANISPGDDIQYTYTS